jgi:hypothetical protein
VYVAIECFNPDAIAVSSYSKPSLLSISLHPLSIFPFTSAHRQASASGALPSPSLFFGSSTLVSVQVQFRQEQLRLHPDLNYGFLLFPHPIGNSTGLFL